MLFFHQCGNQFLQKLSPVDSFRSGNDLMYDAMCDIPNVRVRGFEICHSAASYMALRRGVVPESGSIPLTTILCAYAARYL